MCYTALPSKGERECRRVKFSDKLDTLQEMARKHAGEVHKLYMIELLAEHAEEPEMTAEFLGWLGGAFA